MGQCHRRHHDHGRRHADDEGDEGHDDGCDNGDSHDDLDCITSRGHDNSCGMLLRTM